VLVLDEPTNDLDIETLELLEELLAQYDGTLFLVSHDRAFLDNVVTQVIAFEGDGRLREYVGGYEDWVRVKKFEAAKGSPRSGGAPTGVPLAGAKRQLAAKAPPPPPKPVVQPVPKSKASNKLGFKEQRELEEIPKRIEALEREQEEIAAALGSGTLYRDNPQQAKQLQERSGAIEEELLQLMERWEDLESRG
jgi:ABC transport system ATP-binding/permease protein